MREGYSDIHYLTGQNVKTAVETYNAGLLSAYDNSNPNNYSDARV